METQQKLQLTSPRSKNFKKTDGCEHIKSFLRENGVEAVALSRTLGLSDTCVGKWIKEGVAPKWTIIAIEGLRRRLRSANEQPKILVLRVEPSQVSMIEGLLKATNISYTQV